MKTGVFLKYSVSYCLQKQFLGPESPQTTSNLIRLTIFIAPFDTVKLKLEQLICKKVLKFVSLDNYFSGL